MLSIYMSAQRFLAPRHEEGPGLVDYALILVLIAMLIIGSLVSLKDQLVVPFSGVVSGLNSH